MESKRKSNILVTGGLGFIGWNFIRYLYNQNEIEFESVVNIDSMDYAAINSFPENSDRYFFYKGKMGEISNEILEKHNIDLIFNFAAHTHVDNSIVDVIPFLENNVLEVGRLISNAKKYWDKRGFSGLFVQISCYDETTRALTKEGLKHYYELKEGDIVFSINPTTKIIEEKKIKKVIVQDYSGNMIHFKNKKTDLLVTPNHRMYFTDKEQKQILFDEAQNILKSNNLYFPKGKYKGKEQDTVSVKGIGDVSTLDLFYVCGMFAGDGFTSVQKRKTISKSGLSKKESDIKRRDPVTGKFIKLTGEQRGNKEFTYCNSYRIFFDVPENDKCRKRLENCLSNLGIKWKAHKNKSGEHIYFSSLEWVEFFKQFGHGFKNKNIPKWMMEYDSAYLNSLFDGLIDSDGHYTKNNKKVFSTSSPQLRNDVCEIAIKLGMSPRFSIRDSNHFGLYNDRIIKSTVPSYNIYFREDNVGLAQKEASTVPYNGKVWCVTVEDNKNLVVERNGILHISGNTDEVFGSIEDQNNLGLPFDEYSLLHPNNPYSASKASAELLIRSFVHTYNFPAIITNCSNNYGPGQHSEKLIPKIISNALNGKTIPIYGDGLQKRDWIFVNDHCEGIISSVKNAKIGSSYLFGTNKNVTNLELTNLVLERLNFYKPIKESYKNLITFVNDRLGHDRNYCIDYTRTMFETGWYPKTELLEGIDKTVLWYLNNCK